MNEVSLQAQIDKLIVQRDVFKAQRDALMLEYCPDEMSEEQIEEWAANQSVSGLNVIDVRSATQSTKPVSLASVNEREVFGSLNEWFLGLPEDHQKLIREDKWMLAEQAFSAGRAALNQQLQGENK